MTSYKILYIILICSCLSNYILTQELGIQNVNRTLEISMVGKMNQTGHWITQFLLNRESTGMSKYWNINLRHTVSKYGGITAHQIFGTLIEPPPKPSDYELVPGIGYYKFHYASRVTASEASSICVKEGGHLLIINSEEESKAIRTIYARHIKDAISYSHIGFVDRDKSRNFYTIFGEPLAKTGFLKWSGSEPNNIGGNQYCGCVISDGLLCDVGCNEKISFFCEYELSWSDL